MKKMTYEEFLKALERGTRYCPLALGLNRALSGKVPMSKELATFLKNCYDKNMSPMEVAEDWA